MEATSSDAGRTPSLNGAVPSGTEPGFPGNVRRSVAHKSNDQTEPQCTSVLQQKTNNTSKPIGDAFGVERRMPMKSQFVDVGLAYAVTYHTSLGPLPRCRMTALMTALMTASTVKTGDC